MTEPVLPAAVYVETSVLRQLPADLSSPDLARLNEVLADIGINKFVPAVVRDEWVVAHQGAARKKRQDMLSAARVLGEYLGDGEAKAEAPDVEKLETEVERVQVERLGAAGFVEIPTPAADVNDLLRLAVRHVKPFGEEDRGFRDAMIARTIAEHAKQFESQEILVISRDDVFHRPEVLRQWEAVGVFPVVVRSLEEAASSLEAGLDDAAKEAIEDEIARRKAFLQTRQSEIFDALKNVEVSEAFIKRGLLQEQAYFGTLERVRQVRPTEITRVSLGHVLRRRRSEGRRRPVTFFVKVAFDITVREILLGSLFSGGPKIRLDAVDLSVSKEELSRLRDFAAPMEEVPVEMTVEREIAVEAWVTENEQGELVGLEIEKITTW